MPPRDTLFNYRNSVVGIKWFPAPLAYSQVDNEGGGLIFIYLRSVQLTYFKIIGFLVSEHEYEYYEPPLQLSSWLRHWYWSQKPSLYAISNPTWRPFYNARHVQL